MTLPITPPARARKAPAAKGTIAAPPQMGDNQPPEPTSPEAFAAKLSEYQAVAQKWIKFELDDETVERIAAFSKQVYAVKKEAAAALKAQTDPLNAQLKDLRKAYAPIEERVDLILRPIDRKLQEFQAAKEAALRAEREAARRAAEEAAREAERAAAKALQSDSLYAAEDAMEAARAADKAQEAAEKADKEKVRIGAASNVGGVQRALAFRTIEKVEVHDVVAAVTFLLQSPALIEMFREPAAKAAREYRRHNPDITAIPGIAIVTEQKVV